MLLGVLCGAFSLHAQNPPPATPPPGTALITGRVVDAEGGAPIASAVVTLSARPQTPAQSQNRVLTDADGRFFFSGLAAGSIDLAAAKPGYIPGSFGQRRPQGASQSIELADAGRRSDVKLTLWRYGTISGRVVDDAGDPFVGIDVRVAQQTFVAGHRQGSMGSPLPTRVVTDDRGMFRFSALTPGDYLVVVPAIVTSEPTSFSGAIRAAGETPRAYLQTMAAVGSAPIISGDRSEGLTGGNRSLVQALAGVPSIPPADGPWLTYETTFFQAATSVGSATAVHVVSGRDAPLSDLVLRLVPTFQVSGTVVGPEGPAASFGVHLLPADSADLPLLDTATAVTDSAGAFTFYGVPPGSYVARVVRTPWPTGPGSRLGLGGSGSGPMSVFTLSGGPSSGPAPIPTEPVLYVSQPVTVADRHVRDLALNLRSGPRVTGRADFDGAAPRPTPAQWRGASLSLEPANGRTDIWSPTGQFTEDGLFATSSLWPGRYLIRVTPPPGWTFKSATSGGRDISGTPIEIAAELTDVVITFTDHPDQIQGTVQGSSDLSPSEAVVLMFPSDPTAWLDYGRASRKVRTFAPSPTGAFGGPAPPQGDYLLLAVPEGSPDWLDWRNPAFLQRAAAVATRVQVREGQPTTCTLTMTRVPQ